MFASLLCVIVYLFVCFIENNVLCVAQEEDVHQMEEAVGKLVLQQWKP